MNVRRFFINIEPSIYKGTRWAVFQPIDVQFTLTASSSPMTHNNIDNRRSICGVGIASLSLAKFVIFRTDQKRRWRRRWSVASSASGSAGYRAMRHRKE